jgi:hypothetical protein
LLQKWIFIISREESTPHNHIITDLLKALLGNGSVNMFQHTTIETVSQQAAASTPMDWRDSNHMTCVFHVVCAELYNKDLL